MKRFGFKGAIAVPTNFIEGKGLMKFMGNFVTHDDFMTWNDLSFLQAKGWEITSHTKSHNCKIDFYTEAVSVNELLGARDVLQAKGFKANNFAMPCGTWAGVNYFLVQKVKKYYDSYRSLQPGANPIPVQNFYDLHAYFFSNKTQLSEVTEWIQKAKDQRQWLILTFHAINNSHEKYSVTPIFFQKVLEMVVDSKIPVVVPNQILSIKGRSKSFISFPEF